MIKPDGDGQTVNPKTVLFSHEGVLLAAAQFKAKPMQFTTFYAWRWWQGLQPNPSGALGAEEGKQSGDCR